MNNLEKFLSVFVVILVLLAFIYIPAVFRATDVCLSYGLPHGYIMLNFDIKCGRTVNQTEYVCSLDDVLSKKCIPE